MLIVNGRAHVVKELKPNVKYIEHLGRKGLSQREERKNKVRVKHKRKKFGL